MNRSRSLVVVSALLVAVGTARAEPATRRAPAATDTRVLDVNRLRWRVGADGSFPWSPGDWRAGLEYRSGGTHPIAFASGLWLGASLWDGWGVALAEYVSEFTPGTRFVGAATDPAAALVYKVAPWRGNPDDTAHVEREAPELDADPSLDPLAHHSWSEYMRGAVPFGAPWRVHRLPDLRTGAPGDSVDVPGPDVLGDGMLWCVYHDFDAARHTSPAGGTRPMRVEVRQTVFAFARPGPLAGTAFVRWDLRNFSGAPMTDLCVGLWSDPDIGSDLHDDLTGCDTTRALVYAYNGGAAPDPAFGAAEPALGMDFLEVPFSPFRFPPGGFAAFSEYPNGADPADSVQTQNVMYGRHPDGTPWLAPGGAPSRFPYSGDPVAGTGWLDAQPSNVKTLATASVPLVLHDDTLRVWAAVIVAQGASPLASVAILRCADDDVQAAFDAGFAEPLPAPRACATSLPDPAEPVFALTRVWPNPSAGGWRLALTLPTSGAAHVDVLDLAGRRVHARDLPWLGPGPHAVELAPGARLRPGLYFARVRFGHAERTARFVALP